MLIDVKSSAVFQWSPDGKILLFGMTNGEVQIFDNAGNLSVSPTVIGCWPSPVAPFTNMV